MWINNRNNIENHFLLEEMEKWVALKIVTKAQLDEVRRNNPTTKTNTNLLLRLAFFLLGIFLVSSFFGLVSLVFINGQSQFSIGIMFVVLTLCCVLATEMLYKQNYFAYGFDDSLLLSIPFSAAIAMGVFTEAVVPVLTVVVICSILCTIRYVHVPSVFLAQLSFVIWIGYVIIEEKIIPAAYLPIVLFGVAIAGFALQHKWSKNKNYFIYKNVLQTIKIFSLLLGYTAMNYFVVRQLSEVLLELHLQPQEDIPLATLFYCTSFAIPLVYLFYGLRQKDRTFLWIGLGTLALAFPSIRYYYDLLPLEIALLLGGSLLFILVYLSISKIKNKTTGVTFKQDVHSYPIPLEVFENTMIITSTVSSLTPTEESPMDFGGGEFSGGGSGENF